MDTYYNNYGVIAKLSSGKTMRFMTYDINYHGAFNRAYTFLIQETHLNKNVKLESIKIERLL